MKKWIPVALGMSSYLFCSTPLVRTTHLILGVSAPSVTTTDTFSPVIGKDSMHVDLCCWATVVKDDKFDPDTLACAAEYMNAGYPGVHTYDEWLRVICWATRKR